jgi:hypothetical protein
VFKSIINHTTHKQPQQQQQFTIGAVTIDIARENNTPGGDATDQQLICARINQLSVQFKQLSYGAEASVTLRELAVDDRLQRGGDAFAQLVRTANTQSAANNNNNNDDGDSDDKTPFITLQYAAKTSEHPDYADVDAVVDLTLSALFVHVNRETISQLIRFALIDLTAAAASAEQKPAVDDVKSKASHSSLEVCRDHPPTLYLQH